MNTAAEIVTDHSIENRAVKNEARVNGKLRRQRDYVVLLNIMCRKANSIVFPKTQMRVRIARDCSVEDRSAMLITIG